MTTKISFILNGDRISYEIKDHWTLLHLLREEMGLIGTKEGCGNGECGACTVIVDKLAVNSCLYLAVDADGKTIDTIEGLASTDGTLHPLQQSFVDNGGQIQACGTCLKLRHSEGSELCPLSTMKDLYDIVKESDRVVTF